MTESRLAASFRVLVEWVGLEEDQMSMVEGDIEKYRLTASILLGRLLCVVLHQFLIV